jgi:hypothetical protein
MNRAQAEGYFFFTTDFSQLILERISIGPGALRPAAAKDLFAAPAADLKA